MNLMEAVRKMREHFNKEHPNEETNFTYEDYKGQSFVFCGGDINHMDHKVSCEFQLEVIVEDHYD